jgi:apolipoprotein N-acyltransferase
VTAAVVLVGVLGYGSWRVSTVPQNTERDPLHVVLLQNSVDTIFDVPPEHFVETCRAYQHQAVAAARQHPDAQVMIWPESVFMSVFPQYTFEGEESLPEGVSLKRAELAEDEFYQHCASTVAAINQQASAAAGEKRNIAQLMGSMTVGFQPDKIARHNTALLLGEDGRVAAQYHKMHPVMFGEYIPLGETWPWIYRLTPMPEGLTRGRQAEAFVVDDYTLAPSICFESTVPHLIRRQIIDLDRRGQSPDMLVSVTNDGWFWGSAQLDLHAQCAIMRAVEHHRPMLVAANTGLSIAADGSGHLLAKGPRRAVQTIAVNVPPDGRFSPYTYYGDWPAAFCLAIVGVCAVVGWRARP